jgi:hypothetical protein
MSARTQKPNVKPSDVEQLAGGRGRRRLTLAEVVASGLPALLVEHGDALLYLDGRLYNALDWMTSGDTKLPEPLPAQILETGVGIEYGWRHAATCRCRYCDPPLETESESAA